MHSCVFLVRIHRFSRFFGSILWPLSLHSQDEVKAAQKNSRRPDHVYSKAVRSPKTNRIAKCFDQRQRFIIAALFISEIYPLACCWKWAFSRAMSHNTFFRQTLWSGEWTQGLGPRSNFPWPFVTYVQKCMQWRKWRNIASRWRFELDAKSGPLEAGDFGKNGDFGEIGDFGKNCHACNGENGEKSPASGNLNWMPKVAPWRLAILAKMAILAKLAILAKIARGLVICGKIFKLDAKSGPFKVDN